METTNELSDRFDPSSPMGSRKWWDYQLAHSWEINGGPAQTSYFMRELIDHLPMPELNFLRSNSLSILDWGCATGEGVAILGHTFPLCRVAGMDIALSAVETAQARFPQYEFMLTEEGEIPRPFDVVLTSNVLEHLDAPLTAARQQALNSRLLYLILVPYWEYPRMYEHSTTFIEESFPPYLGGLVRLSLTPFKTDPKVWAGRQVLVVYGSRTYLRARQQHEGTRNPELSSDDDLYFNSPPEMRVLLESLAEKCARSETASKLAAREIDRLKSPKEKLIKIRERLAPIGTRRRKWLNFVQTRLLSKAMSLA
jgi:SAM-dependent methyltransferase